MERWADICATLEEQERGSADRSEANKRRKGVTPFTLVRDLITTTHSLNTFFTLESGKLLQELSLAYDCGYN
jgi:hypothetical protein